MKKQWIFPNCTENGSLPGVHSAVAGLLAMRGIRSPEEVSEFLAEKPHLAHDPFLMKDLPQAARLVLETIGKGGEICIYGDYDADGVCSVSLLTLVLNALGAKVSHYIPSRFSEGYGVNREALEEIAARGVSLVVTVDCGITSLEEVEYAKGLGLQIIVTDHHNPGEEVPDCLVLNPKREGCQYPEKYLCGCGVAFKLAQGLQRLSQDWPAAMKTAEGAPKALERAAMLSTLDLVAIATIGDIVPLTGENRSLAKHGLNRMNRKLRLGLEALKKTARLEKQINGEAVAYAIVPRLNAAGRINSAETGVTLLTEEDLSAVEQAAISLEECNRERKQIQDAIFEEACRMAEAEGEDYYWSSGAAEEELTEEEELLMPPLLLLPMEDAHEGIMGIVAGKLKDRYNVPVVILTYGEDGSLKGSGRAPEGIDLYKLLSEAAPLYSRFGGHAGACGLTISEENYPEAEAILMDAAERLRQEQPDLFVPKVHVDWVLQPEDITSDLIDDLDRCGPFGAGNPAPFFALRGVKPENLRYMGDGENHLRFTAGGITCVLFRASREQKELLLEGCPLDLGGVPTRNVWKNREYLQFQVRELQRA
ncbi:MAG: single-stranded-DNA-specific exonuclease RecJ [Clostridiales bacterium]|nr:single-stranded-DNA-specific exonuclease RecJ [Clostridiales bacterium]